VKAVLFPDWGFDFSLSLRCREMVAADSITRIKIRERERVSGLFPWGNFDVDWRRPTRWLARSLGGSPPPAAEEEAHCGGVDGFPAAGNGERGGNRQGK